MFVATLIAAGKLTGEVVREAIDRLDATGHEVGAPHWLDEGDAADIVFHGSLVSARAELAKMDHGALDVIVQPLGDRTKKLIIADMDRSEEHTSELQSLMRLSYAVFCLKKKNKH